MRSKQVTSPKILKQISYAEIIKLSVLDNDAKEIMQTKPYEKQDLGESAIESIKRARKKREGNNHANE